MSIGIDQDRIRWPGSGSAVSGSTPFGFYDTDSSFTLDCYNSAKWAATRLGYPIVDIELKDVNFYACFEEAVAEYGAQVNQFNIKNNYLNLIGKSTSENLGGKPVIDTGLNYIIKLANGYGTEALVGGSVNLKKGYIDVAVNQQTYDLQTLWGNVSESYNRLEIRKIYHGPSPAFARIYDPFSMTGMSYSNVLNEMGFAGYSPATQFLMTPIFEDLLRGQAIEFNDMVRKSGYSFELINNKLKIFPIPTTTFKLYFEYYLENEKANSMFISGSTPYSSSSDYSNIPYQNIPYFSINSVGRQWIKKYFLALCKELLGAVRQKYSTVPIPGGEVTLDGAELRSEANTEKEALITQLREMLEATTLDKQLESNANKVEKTMTTLKSVPNLIYIG
jgi:hypothetical protein